MPHSSPFTLGKDTRYPLYRGLVGPKSIDLVVEKKYEDNKRRGGGGGIISYRKLKFILFANKEKNCVIVFTL
jgi:hypothetical protein